MDSRVRTYLSYQRSETESLNGCQPGAQFTQQVYARKLAEEEDKFEYRTDPS